jgi:hypothetical protein
MQIIHAVFNGSVIREGFGKLSGTKKSVLILIHKTEVFTLRKGTDLYQGEGIHRVQGPEFYTLQLSKYQRASSDYQITCND